MGVVDRSFDDPLQLEEHCSAPLAGGIMGNGYQCGMIWGAALAAGARSYRLFGPGAQAEATAILAAQRLVESFRALNKHMNCADLTEMNLKSSSNRRMLAQLLKFFLRGGPAVCFSMSASYARVAFDQINASVPAAPVQALTPPVSCAAMLVQQMGGSSMHAALAAGFAGGVGLSGGGCGALGTALWFIGMEKSKQGDEVNSFIPDWGDEVLQRFLESAGYEFECSKIIGRKFESIDDHAGYLHAGGCSKIIEALAALS